MSAKKIMVVISVLSSSTIAQAQNVSIFPKTPAFVDVNHELTFMCKSSAHEEWRNTLFFDETEDDGLSSVGLFYQNTNGTCIQSIISEKYQAACDIAKGEFNLTIRKIDRQYHDKMISCTTQFGNGTIEYISVTKTAKIYVKVPVSDINISETEIETDVSFNFTIRCSVISRPAATVKWIRFNADGLQDDITSFSQVSSNHSIAGETVSSVLTIKFSKFDNDGHLQCEANNSFSFRQSQDIPLHIYCNRLRSQIQYNTNALDTSIRLHKTPIVLSDSKARYLRDEVIRGIERDIVWWFEGGATVEKQFGFLQKNLEIELHRHPRIVLYLWLGTCNLTVKDGGLIQLKSSDNSSRSANELITKFREIYDFVRCFPTVELVLLELPPYSIFETTNIKVVKILNIKKMTKS
ncbi:unnamed protein product [Mytilus coruscus]|uniref:Ig-like domain-containing protein n=1 Tax=Mytilus coruscus TaxID=42192 RepID=A0A6J8CA87_MYTCO|nr:unnamed protein product [Mytilus coruscus]